MMSDMAILQQFGAILPAYYADPCGGTLRWEQLKSVTEQEPAYSDDLASTPDRITSV
jgi:hypothetical protein